MEDICHAAEVPGSRGSRAARRPLLRQGAKARDTPSRKMLFLNRSVYFSRRFVDGILNRCHVFTGALLIMPSPRGLAHGEVYISAADAQLHTCGCDSLQTLGSGGLVLSPVWLTPGTSERHSTHCWWSYTHTYTHTHTHKQVISEKYTVYKSLSLEGPNSLLSYALWARTLQRSIISGSKMVTNVCPFQLVHPVLHFYLSICSLTSPFEKPKCLGERQSWPVSGAGPTRIDLRVCFV